MLRLVTTRQVGGEQRDGRWLVVEADVERLERDSLSSSGHLATA
jgi:hypothetical protein